MNVVMATVIQAVYCILFKIVFLNVSKSEFAAAQFNETHYASQWESSGKSKRSLHDTIPKKLEITFSYATGELTTLQLLATHQYLANGYLPFITPDADIKVMEDVDEFVMYHDKDKCSAAVYFMESKKLYGIIGTDHYIQNLEIEFDEAGKYQLGIVSEPFVRERNNFPGHIHPENVFPPPSDTDTWEDFLRAPFYHPDHDRKRKVSCNAGPGAKHQRNDKGLDGRNDGETNAEGNRMSRIKKPDMRCAIKRYYLEILVFVARDIAELFKKQFGTDTYIDWIMRYYIVYFNSVDMIVQKFPTRLQTLHINIAKIVIENDLQPFDFMSDDVLQFANIVAKLPQYLDAHQNDYIPDSFDHVFIHTSRVIMDDIVPITGLSKVGKDMYEARKNDQFYNVVPITVVKYRNSFADYVVAAHEIGRTFNIRVDSRANGLTSIGQCHGIMQIGGPKCMKCLKWSDDSVRQLNVFFSSNRNRCFLMNEPRSLRPPGPSLFVTPHRQCVCFGYHSYCNLSKKPLIKKSSCNVKSYECPEFLQCDISDGIPPIIESTVRPFDGTPCGYNKVCWNGICSNRQILPDSETP